MADSELIVHEIEEIDLKSVFHGEASGFTPWLARPENLSRLSKVLALELAEVETEQSTGVFRLDLIATNEIDGSKVIIENQFSRSNHDHLGKALTYLAANQDGGAKTVVWLAESFAAEHRAVLAWLNDNTPEDIGFWGIVPKVLRIAGGPPGLRFDVIVRPNPLVKEARAEKKFSHDPKIREFRGSYWPKFQEELRRRPGGDRVATKFGGQVGHLHLFPSEGFKMLEPPVFCNAYLVAPTSETPRTGVWRGYSSGTSSFIDLAEVDEKLDLVRAKAVEADVYGEAPANFSDEIHVQQSLIAHVDRTMKMLGLLDESFGHE